MTQLSLLILFVALLACHGGADKDTTPGRTSSPSRNVDICQLPMEPGPCRMRLERYYYNPETNSCEIFNYGGCRGNDNKFGFRKTCEDACKRPGPSPTPASAQRQPSSASKAPTAASTSTPAPTPAAQPASSRPTKQASDFQL